MIMPVHKIRNIQLGKDTRRLAFVTLLLFVMFAVTVITGMYSTAQAGERERFVRVGAEQRSYILYSTVNPGMGGKPPAVVIVLHGEGSDVEQAKRQTGMSRLAENKGFWVIYPQATNRGSRGMEAWNADTCCGDAAVRKVNDVGYISAIIDDVKKRYRIDASRIYVVGHSNGAMLAYKLACEIPDKVAAIATNAGIGIFTGCEKNKRRVPIMHIHGTADNCMPFEGGQQCGGCRASLMRAYGFPGTDDSFACHAVMPAISSWMSWNGCGGGRPLKYNIGGMECEVSDNCLAPVGVCTVEQGGHVWHGGEYAPEFCKMNTYNKLCRQYKEERGEINKSLQLSQMMWVFLEKFTLGNSGWPDRTP